MNSLKEKFACKDTFSKFMQSLSKTQLDSAHDGYLDKIVHILTNLKDDKLKMIYEVIRIIVGGNHGKSEISSLISSEVSGLLTTSDKISHLHELYEDGSYKNFCSNNALRDWNQDNHKKDDLLLRKSYRRERVRINANNEFRQKKKIINDPPKIFSKVYELSDKTSLVSNDDTNQFKQIFEQPLERNSKFRKLKIIDPRIQNNSHTTSEKKIGKIISYPLSKDYGKNSFSTTEFNKKYDKISNIDRVSKCPKVLLDYEHSSSDFDTLLVTSARECLKNNRLDNKVVNGCLRANTLNNPLVQSQSNIVYTSNKPKQIFFPCEVNNPTDKTEPLRIQNNIFSSGQAMPPFTCATPRTTQYEFFPSSSIFTNSNIFKQPISQHASSGVGLYSMPGPISLNISLFNNGNNNEKK